MGVPTKYLLVTVLLAAILLPPTAIGSKCDCCPCPCTCECEEVNQTDTTEPPQTCPEACLNLGFIIDGSGSISATEWSQTVDFLIELVSSFTIGPDYTETGLVQFSTDARTEYDFPNPANDDLTSLITELNIIKGKQKGGQTYLHLGIKEFIDVVWPTRRIELPSRCSQMVPAVVVMTDGAVTNKEAAIDAADELRATVGNVYGVAVGTEALESLNDVLGETVSVFKVDQADQLSTILKDLLVSICNPDIPPVPPAPMPINKCKCCCPPPVPVAFHVRPWSPPCESSGGSSSSSTYTSSVLMTSYN
jgi:collagen type VI alpha